MVLMVRKGDRVTVHYRGTLSDGKVFDSSEGLEPLVFTLGAGSMLPGFEKNVIGMKVGQIKKFTIPASEAYGPRRDQLVLEVKREQLPAALSPRVGDRLKMPNSGGGTTQVRVTRVSETSVTIDGNHELAGKDLTFEVKLVSDK
jgi:peptidylprolyl isomerase